MNEGPPKKPRHPLYATNIQGRTPKAKPHLHHGHVKLAVRNVVAHMGPALTLVDVVIYRWNFDQDDWEEIQVIPKGTRFSEIEWRFK